MSLAFLDPYHPVPSPIHSIDARVKLVATFLFIVIFNVTPIQAWPAHLGYLLAVIGILSVGRAAPTSVLKRSMLAAPFVLMAALGLPFVAEGKPMLTIPWIPWRLTITDLGALRFANVIAKSWLSVLVVLALADTTPFLAIIKAMRSLGIPPVIASIIMLMYRYMYVLVDEALRLTRARDARTAEPEQGRKRGALLWRARVTGNMIGTLFLRTYERSERIYSAMLARGYSGEIRMLSPARLSRRDVVLGGASVAVLAVVAILANITW